MEPQGGNKYLAAYRDETNRTPEEDHSQIVGARSISGLNAERKRKIFRHRAEGKMFLLTFPYIGRYRQLRRERNLPNFSSRNRLQNTP